MAKANMPASFSTQRAPSRSYRRRMTSVSDLELKVQPRAMSPEQRARSREQRARGRERVWLSLGERAGVRARVSLLWIVAAQWARCRGVVDAGQARVCGRNRSGARRGSAKNDRIQKLQWRVGA